MNLDDLSVFFLVSIDIETPRMIKCILYNQIVALDLVISKALRQFVVSNVKVIS